MSDTNPAIDEPDPERPGGAPEADAAAGEDAEDVRTAPALRHRDSGGGDVLS
ncbi:MAG: hypothetical protein ACTHJL_01475 [Amnibacterium sp.]